MLRHFKMELKRQQMMMASQENSQVTNENNRTTPAAAATNFVHHQQQPVVVSTIAAAVGPVNCCLPLIKEKVSQKLIITKQSVAGGDKSQNQQPKRVRGRRSSKPQMEKRRRARINECLDILKSYVLTDTNNLNHLGIDTTGSENQDEETIARRILKSSGLINRHRGRKNPNKLEKADILELTVDYVRRLHEQRDDLLRGNSNSNHILGNDLPNPFQVQLQQQQQQLIVPAHLNQPLTLDLSPKSRLNGQTIPITPPPSSASSSPNNANQLNHRHPHDMSQLILSKVLDNYGVYEWHH